MKVYLETLNQKSFNFCKQISGISIEKNFSCFLMA